MIEHMVLIRWKDDTSREQARDVLATAGMLENIPGVESVSVRPTCGTNRRDHGIRDVMIVRMADEDALERFGPHELHRRFGTRMLPLAEDLTIVDVRA
jgi:hypothetical protein